MFDIGWSEMAVILLVALIVIGPRDLPRVARTMGRWVAKGRAMAREFQTALEDMAREAELDKVKSEIEKAGRGIESVSRTNIGKTIENTVDPTGELSKAFDPTAGAGKPDESVAKAAPEKAAEPAAAPAGPSVATADAKVLEAEPAVTASPPKAAPAKRSAAKRSPAKSSKAKPAPAKSTTPTPEPGDRPQPSTSRRAKSAAAEAREAAREPAAAEPS